MSHTLRVDGHHRIPASSLPNYSHSIPIRLSGYTLCMITLRHWQDSFQPNSDRRSDLGEIEAPLGPGSSLDADWSAQADQHLIGPDKQYRKQAAVKTSETTQAAATSDTIPYHT
jgi:hypothetical protein